MTSMLERMARAMARQHWPDDTRWKTYSPAARAALTALLEPSATMRDAGGNVFRQQEENDKETWENKAHEVFCAMIQSAIDEGK